jgi:PAS domain S-box-containing protein
VEEVVLLNLADFIRNHHEAILREWESFARTLLPAAEGMSQVRLRHHADEILTAIVGDMETPQTEAERAEKSKGLRERGPLGVLGGIHATLRTESGFEVSQLVAEYRALRASVFRLWGNEGHDLAEAIRFNEAIVEAVAEAVAGGMETRLGESEAHFRLLVESVKDYAIFILDERGRVRTWNPGAARIKGYTAPEIIGKHFSVFYPPDEVASGKCDRELETASREGRLEEEGWRVRKDGSCFWANVTITALRKPGGTLIGFAKVTQDLTARRETEAKLRIVAAEKAALAERAAIQEFQERFLAVLGHDLRNPLASMEMGRALLLQRPTIAGDPASARVLGRMETSSRRMALMIEQILDLTRSRLGGGLEIRPAPTNLCTILNGIVDELRIAHPTRAIELRCASLPGTWDKDRLEQVFSNIVGNAIDHGVADKPVTVEASLEGTTVRVDVHNEAPPIPEDLRAKLFSPFRRGNQESRTSHTAGLGLGLYISNEIVAAHGGAIDVHSSSVEGTTFRVTLPRSTGTPPYSKARGE